MSSEAGEQFVILLATYAGIGTFFALFFSGSLCTLRRIAPNAGTTSNGHGLFAIPSWPWHVRGLTSLMIVLFAIVPTIVIVTCLILGPLLALAEGWSAILGIEYLLSNALGLAVPLTDIMPDSVSGEIIDLLISIWAMLIVTCAVGLAAQMALIAKLADVVPGTTLGFVRYLVVNIPLLLIVTSMVAGAIMAAIEGWSFADGFFYMAGEAAGVSLVSNGPSTAAGALVESIFTMFELGFGGAVIGVVAEHPLTTKIVEALEGTAEEQQATAEGSGNIDEAKPKALKDMTEEEVQREIAMLQGRLAELREAWGVERSIQRQQ